MSIRIDLNIPQNFRNSLGDHLSLKRQWNLYGERTDIFPEMTKGQRTQLTKFLNQIDYTYIPAIKDAELYSDLVERLYEAIASSSGIVGATDGFIGSIRSQTSDLSESLSKLFGAQTKLSTPSEMGALFRSLDFAHGDDEHSLLRQKGDGVKARHIPELLAYINRNETSKKFFIWGFEEPENSLDLQSADAEAQSMALRAGRSDTQIFCTSHSPAFYLAGGSTTPPERVARYFITKQVKPDAELTPANAALRIGTLEEAEAAMAQASLLQLPYLIRKWSDLREDHIRVSHEAETLRKKVEGLSAPTIFVEGIHDKALFERVTQDDLHMTAIQFRTLGGTPKAVSEYLTRFVDGEVSSSSQYLAFIFDNDPPGRAAYCSLSKNKSPGPAPFQMSEKLRAWCLPPTEEWLQFQMQFAITSEAGIFESEFLYPGDEAARILFDLMSADEVVEYSSCIHSDYNRSLSQKAANQLRSARAGSAAWLWARGVPDNKKSSFNRKAASSLDSTRAGAVVTALLL